MKYPGNDYRNYLAHALNLRKTVNNGNWGNGRGSWQNHKYLYKEGNRYIYPDDLGNNGQARKGAVLNRATQTNFKDRASTASDIEKSTYNQTDRFGKAYRVNPNARTKDHIQYYGDRPQPAKRPHAPVNATQRDAKVAAAQAARNQPRNDAEIANNARATRDLASNAGASQTVMADLNKEVERTNNNVDPFERAGNWVNQAGKDIGNWWQQNIANPVNNWAYGNADDPNDGAFERAGNWFNQAGKDVGNWWQQNIANPVNNWAYGNADDPNDGAFEKAGNWVNGAVADAGKWLGRAGRDVGRAAEDSWNWLTGARDRAAFENARNQVGQPGSRVTGQEMEQLRKNDTGGAIGAAGRWLQGAANDVGNAVGSAAEWARTAPTNVPAQLWLNQTGGVANVYNNYAARINDALQSGDTRKANTISANAISDLVQKGNMLRSYWENLVASGAPESEINRVQAEIDAALNAINALMGPSP